MSTGVCKHNRVGGNCVICMADAAVAKYSIGFTNTYARGSALPSGYTTTYTHLMQPSWPHATSARGLLPPAPQTPHPDYGGLDPEMVPNDHMVGLRSFRVDELGRLFPVTASRTPWVPGENVSVCSRGGHDKVSVDNEGNETRDTRGAGFAPDCSCGFYAFHNGDNTFNGAGQVTGVVKGYGRTVVGTKGFRSEKAEVIGLVLPGVEPEAADVDEPEPAAKPFDRFAHRRAWRVRWGTELGVWLGVAALAFAAGIAAGAGFLASVMVAFVGFAAAYRLSSTWRGYLDPKCTGDACCVGRSSTGIRSKRWLFSHGDSFGQSSPHRCACSYPQWRDGSWDGKSDNPPTGKGESLDVFDNVTDHLAALIRRNYPDVAVYASVEDMVAANPLTPPIAPPEPTPDEPGFWSRPAKGLS